ncbi:MAG: PH domain-containing protein [Lachnospiraceae bacterium]|nr:PH domain-containing protein [Lachnospiraceae bacterium]
MIDFKNKKVFKLSGEKVEKGAKAVKDLLISGEEVIDSYSSVRDRLVFTNKRVISINVQGVTGTKKDYTSIPYKRIQTFSIETSGIMDLDAELSFYISSVGEITFQLSGGSNIRGLCAAISEHIL